MQHSDSVQALDARLAECMLSDEERFRSRLRALGRRRGGGRDGDALRRLADEIARSAERRVARSRARPEPTFPSDLPITAKRDEIAAAILAHPVVVVCGETGSGKSTQLPKICLSIGRGAGGMIGHTQPRRIAARSIAARIASELGTTLGGVVGFKVRFGDRTGPDALVKVMTDGILLAETQSDRRLAQYDTIIIDEAHERSLNVDFLLGYLAQLLPDRPELKIIVTSATIDPERFSAHFGGAPIIEVSGRAHPVELRQRPIGGAEGVRDRDLVAGVLEAVDEVARDAPGDVLVFLSGEREIRETAEALRKHHPPQTEILPLYARLSAEEQNRVFDAHPGRRIVLATNVAETSLTVPGIRAVVDPGFARVRRYSPRTKVERLPVEPISQASAQQRAGRCGRVGPGLCIRLYDDFDDREPYTAPEILRSNLAGVILRMKALGLGSIEKFPFIDPPRKNMVRDGYDTLHELGAIDDRERLTTIGERLAKLPIDPRLGRMILAAHEEGCLAEVLIIAAALSVIDPRTRPADRAAEADEAQREFADERSDFLSLLAIWRFFHEGRQHLSWSKLRKACTERFISFERMREWCDVHQQLRTLAAEQTMRPAGSGPLGSKSPEGESPDFDRLHRALLAGLLSNVALKGTSSSYEAARGGEVWIFPGSALAGRSPKWIMAAEMVETTRRWARTVAVIRPEWIEEVGAHLLSRKYSAPEWDERSGRVIAFERVTLYGLEVVARRCVHYGPIDAVASRELFIHYALVEGEIGGEAPFLRHNRRLREELETIEAKRRRRDVVIDARREFDFWDRRLPPDVSSRKRFERWRRTVEREDPRRLFMRREDLLQEESVPIDENAFPDEITLGGVRLPLEYKLDPGADDDGVSVTVPAALVAQIDAERLEWLVPGLLREKVIALIKTLPKTLRVHFVPAPEWADRALASLAYGSGSFTAALGRALEHAGGPPVPASAWNVSALPAHLRMNVKVADIAGEVIVTARDVEQLRSPARMNAREEFERLAAASFEREGIRDFDFDPLPESVEVRAGKAGTVRGWPALDDRDGAAAIRVFESRDAAVFAHERGLRRLFAIRCDEELRVHVEYVAGIDRARLHFAAIGGGVSLDDELVLLVAGRAFLAEEAERTWSIRSRDAFEARLDANRPALWEATGAVGALAVNILEEHHALALAIDRRSGPAWAACAKDVRAQVERLCPPRFLTQTPYEWLSRYPSYLRAARLRLERVASAGLDRDLERSRSLGAWWSRYAERKVQHEERGIVDPALERFRWLLEEWRVSLFAQELGTILPVSEKRIESQWLETRA